MEYWFREKQVGLHNFNNKVFVDFAILTDIEIGFRYGTSVELEMRQLLTKWSKHGIKVDLNMSMMRSIFFHYLALRQKVIGPQMHC